MTKRCGRFVAALPALLLALLIPSATAQLGINCASFVAGQQTLRQEGATEPVSDIIVSCNGTLVGAQSGPQTLSLYVSGAAITSRQLGQQGSSPFVYTEAALLINDCTTNVGTSSTGASCAPNGTFQGGNPVQGILQNGALVFSGFTLPVGGAPFQLRITNVRVNANSVAAGSSVTATLLATFTVQNQQGLVLGTVQPSLSVKVAPPVTNLSQCQPQTTTITNLTISELFNSAFKSPATSTANNTPGAWYQNGVNTESQFAFQNFANAEWVNQLSGVVPGQADAATRIRVNISGIPTGMTLTLPVNVSSNGTGALVATTSDTGPFTAVGGTGITLNSSGSVIYEVRTQSSSTLESFNIPITVSYTGNPGSGAISVSASYAPTSSTSGAIPLFVDTSSPAVLANVTSCEGITSINPSSASAGSPGFTMTVMGSNFTNVTVVTWNGSPLSTTYLTRGMLTAIVPTSLLVNPGVAQVTVSEPGQSDPPPIPFYILGPVPTLTSLSPTSVAAGGPTFALTLNGSNFIPQTQAYWNSTLLPTTFVSTNQLIAMVPTTLIGQPTSVPITAQTGSQTSNGLTFVVTTPQLSLISLSPGSALAGGPAFTLTVNGLSFTTNTSVTWNGTGLFTTYVNSTQLTAAVPANLIASAGTVSVGVSAPGQTSPTPLPFAITQGLTLISLAPSSTPANSPAFTLLINGAGFNSGTTVSWNNTPLTATLINASQMSAVVPANLLLQTGAYSITAQNGNQTSNALPFTVTPPLVLNSISPNSAIAGAQGFTLFAIGVAFNTGSQLVWNGTPLATTFISSTQLSAPVPASFIAAPASLSITVQNGTQSSNALPFTITAPLTLTNLSPSTAAAGGPAFTLTATGTGFNTGTQLVWNATGLSTTFISTTQVSAVVPAGLIAAGGSPSVTAQNGTVASNALPFFITSSGLTLTSISPNSAIAGGPAFSLTANGSGFTNATLVTWNGSPLTTTFVSATQLTAVVPANLTAAPGTAAVGVSTLNQTSPPTLPFVITSGLTLTSLSPGSAAVGGPAFTITVGGTGFTASTTLLWNGSALATTFVNATNLTATVPANLIGQSGNASVTAQNGNLSSNGLAFSITSPPITLRSLSPSSTPAGTQGLTLTVNGSGFVPPSGTSVTWNGTVLSTTVASTTQLTAIVPASLLTTQGIVSVGVTGGPSQPTSLPFTVTSSVTLTSISPTVVSTGGPAFTLTASGSGFLPNTIVTWNGSALATTYVSATQLTAAVPASFITTAGTAAIDVSVPAGQQPPSALQLTIASGLTLTSLSPTSAIAGSPAFALTVNGTGFTAGVTVNWNSTALATTFVSATQLTATVPAALILQPASVSITATNGTQVSNALTLNVLPPTPAITSLAPSTAVAGGAAFSLTVNGKGFLPTSAVTWNGAGLQASYVNATQLTATVTNDLIGKVGTAAVVVLNGTLASNSATFAIIPPAPIITGIAPSTVVAGGAAFNMSVSGSGFQLGAAVSLNSSALATTFVNATQVTATVPANLITQPGAPQITLVNPIGPASNAVTLTITAPVPTITSITPSSAIAGGPAFSLNITGTGFLSGASILWNGANLNTSFISATQLVAAVTSDLITQSGTVQITAANSGEASSNAVPFTIKPPTPTITNISPSTIAAGGPPLTLTVTGTNFLSGVTVSLNGTALTTTFVSTTQLTAAVPANLIAQGGAAQIIATNPGGVASPAVTLTITTPTPTITSISPATIPPGGPQFILTVNGTNFLTGSIVSFNGTALPTTFVSPIQLTAIVAANLVVQISTVQITVANPGGTASNAVILNVSSAAPTISSISPATVQAGGPAFTLTVTGTNFLTGATVVLNDTRLATTFLSSAQLSAQVTADLIAQPGIAQITVADPGGAPSIAIATTLTITAAAPTISSLSPNSARVGDPTFTLAVTGTGFLPTSIVQWDGAPLSTTLVSPTQLTATVSDGRLIQPATANVTVVNGETSLLVSNSLPFAITPVTPSISSVAPTSANAGDAALSLTVNGSGFLTLTTIQWNSTVLTTHYVSTTQVAADVPGTLLALPGTATITAVNPGSKSAAVTFTINPRVPPSITSLSKTSATAGDPTFTLTVTGTGFVSGALVNFGTNTLATTFVSSTQLTASITANLLLLPNTYQIVVQQPGTASNAVSFVVNLPPPPSVRLNPPANPGPAQQPTIDFGLNAPYPLALTGTVTLSFVSNATVPSDDPAIQFASGGRSMTFTVPPNTTTLPAIQISTGTVAGTLTLAATFSAAGQNVTPPGLSATIVIAKAAPVILAGKVKLVRGTGTLEVDITAFSTTRDMTQAVFHLNAAPGAVLLSTDITVPLSPLFTSWYQSAASTGFGSQFSYAQPFNVTGDTNQIQSVSVTLTNSAGSSVSMTSN